MLQNIFEKFNFLHHPLIFSRGPLAFDIFRQALRHHYEWLSDDMDKLEENGKSFSDIKYMDTPTLPPISPLTVVREEKVCIYVIKTSDIYLLLIVIFVIVYAYLWKSIM